MYRIQNGKGIGLWSLVHVKARTERRKWTELNWHGLVLDELTIGQARRAYWSLVDAYVSIVTYSIVGLGGAYCSALYPVYTIEQTSNKHQAGLMEPRPLAQM